MSAVFDAYAAYYDLLYRDKDYAAEAAYVAALVRSRRPGAVRILELGCGTGAHAEHLVRLGFEVVGVDLSEPMLVQARARRDALPAELSRRLSFGPGDVRTLRLGERFDAVISLFHVISYQTSNDELDCAFSTAAEHLGQDGVFLFDYWYGPAVLTQRPSVRVRRIEGEQARVQRIAEPDIDTETNVVMVNYSVSVEDRANGATYALVESHPLRYLFLPEIDRLASGLFVRPQHFGWMKDERPNDGDWAAVTLLERAP
ncbi:MAG: class I SAM-dependent methyltransferase [Burkholderiales bacterium]|nr:MAG: class I SAM-dependent methyltransferase [Burkholderiales bacterium]